MPLARALFRAILYASANTSLEDQRQIVFPEIRRREELYLMGYRRHDGP